jgi:hypothetical protein
MKIFDAVTESRSCGSKVRLVRYECEDAELQRAKIQNDLCMYRHVEV